MFNFKIMYAVCYPASSLVKKIALIYAIRGTWRNPEGRL